MVSLNHEYDVTITEPSNKPNDPSKYNDALKKLCTVSTTEHLAYILHRLVNFEKSQPFNMNFFLKGIQASWEDQSNIDGCSWSIQCKPEFGNIFFEKICIYFLTNGYSTFECNGISANVRKNFVKFTIWSKHVPLVSNCADVLDELKASFGFDSTVVFSYRNHKDLIEKVFEGGKIAV